MNPPVKFTPDHTYTTNFGRRVTIVSREGRTLKTRCGQTFKVSASRSKDRREVAVGPIPQITMSSDSVFINECA